MPATAHLRIVKQEQSILSQIKTITQEQINNLFVCSLASSLSLFNKMEANTNYIKKADYNFKKIVVNLKYSSFSLAKNFSQ